MGAVHGVLLDLPGIVKSALLILAVRLEKYLQHAAQPPRVATLSANSQHVIRVARLQNSRRSNCSVRIAVKFYHVPHPNFLQVANPRTAFRASTPPNNALDIDAIRRLFLLSSVIHGASQLFGVLLIIESRVEQSSPVLWVAKPLIPSILPACRIRISYVGVSHTGRRAKGRTRPPRHGSGCARRRAAWPRQACRLYRPCPCPKRIS